MSACEARAKSMREDTVLGRARLQPCRAKLCPLRALAPEVRRFSMRLRAPRERTVPQRLKPRGKWQHCGTAKAVPFHDRVLAAVKPLRELQRQARMPAVRHDRVLAAVKPLRGVRPDG